MSLYWYSIPNLGMGYYVLRATGTGGFQIGGTAVFVIRKLPKKPTTIDVVTVDETDPRIILTKEQIGVLQAIARLEGIVPVPSPPPGEIVIPVSSGETKSLIRQQEKYNNIISKMMNRPTPVPVSSSKIDVKIKTKSPRIIFDGNSQSVDQAIKTIESNEDILNRLKTSLLILRSRT